jgi:hypothetical protein
MNKDVQKRPIPDNLEEKGKIVEILNKDDYLEDELADKTLYGEYMSTYHYWTSPEEQRKRVNHIENITENKERK